jgi:probable rRNA maturation factor
MKPGALQICVRNFQHKVRVDVVDLEKFARKAMALCLDLRNTKTTDLEMLREISVLIVSDRRMATLHSRFMNVPGSTDVITFQHGEIFISAEMAVRNARRFATALIHELRLYIVHGLLHLSGFDDQTEAAARKMRAMQEKVLAKVAL